jgi:hypothetical protein
MYPLVLGPKYFAYYELGNNREIVPGKFVESSWKVPGKFADFC